jgi:hypothetical protein
MSHPLRTLRKYAESAMDAIGDLRLDPYVVSVTIDADGPRPDATVTITEAGMDSLWSIGGAAHDDPDETLGHLAWDGVEASCTYSQEYHPAVLIVAAYASRPGWLDDWQHTDTTAKRVSR